MNPIFEKILDVAAGSFDSFELSESLAVLNNVEALFFLHLILDCTHIHSEEDAIRHLASIDNIVIFSRGIIPDGIRFMQNLVDIVIVGTISKIPKGLFACKEITHIDFSSSSLKSICGEWSKLNKLEHVRLQDNPFSDISPLLSLKCDPIIDISMCPNLSKQQIITLEKRFRNVIY